MSDNSDIADIAKLQEEIDDATWLRERKHLLIMKRSTFNKRKALMMKPYFDKALKLGQDTLIPVEDFKRYQVSTLYKIAADSLLFLRMKLPEEAAVKYQRLKSAVRLETTSKGIWIRFISHIHTSEEAMKILATEDLSHLVMTPAEEKKAAAAADIQQSNAELRKFDTVREEIARYLEEGSGVKEWLNLDLTEEEMQHLKEAFAKCNLASLVEPNLVRVMR